MSGQPSCSKESTNPSSYSKEKSTAATNPPSYSKKSTAATNPPCYSKEKSTAATNPPSYSKATDTNPPSYSKEKSTGPSEMSGPPSHSHRWSPSQQGVSSGKQSSVMFHSSLKQHIVEREEEMKVDIPPSEVSAIIMEQN